MKSIFLTVIVVCALATAGIGGTLATWSDSEVAFGNYIETGSIDLKVNQKDDAPWGEGIEGDVAVECMIPCQWYGPYPVELWNAAEVCMPDAEAYIHVKTLECSNIDPKERPDGTSSGYPDPEANNDLKPEPELVAEHGGKVNCVMVEGIGIEGDDCSMGSGVQMAVTATEIAPNEPGAERLGDLDFLGKWVCKEIYLFDLEPCTPRTIYLWFHLTQHSEEDLGLEDLIKHPNDMVPVPTGDDYDAALMHWEKFNDWPSWAYMNDKAVFDIEFDLLLKESMPDSMPAGSP